MVGKYTSTKGCSTVCVAGKPPQNLTFFPVGTPIEVWLEGILRYQGEVVETAPHLEVFWIRDAIDGTRRIINPTEYRIKRS